MTAKERQEHAFDISNTYVAKISPEETDIMNEIQGLPIQDIITIYSNANYALEEGMFVEINKETLNAGDESAIRFKTQ